MYSPMHACSPVRCDLTRTGAMQVFMSLFACGDKHFMTMFYAESAIQALTQKTESLARRAEGLTKCKNEFADLARCL